MSISHILILCLTANFFFACKTCDQAWNEYRKSIDKKRLFGSCTVNYDCVAVKELPNFVYSNRGMGLFEQEKSDGLKEDAKRICWDESSIKAQDKNNKGVKPSERPSDFKANPAEPCCLDNKCVLAYPGSCNFKVIPADQQILDRNKRTMEKSVALFKKGDYKRAYRIIKDIKMKDDQKQQQNFLMGISLLRLNDFQNAYKLLSEAVAADPEDLTAGYYFMCAAHNVGKNDLIKPTLDKIAEKARTNKEAAEDYAKKLNTDSCFDKIRNEKYFQNAKNLVQTYAKMARN